MDRPSRKTKTVNYCESKGDFDDDEDFATVKAPPSKKAKEDARQEQKKVLSKSSSQESNLQSVQNDKSRKPLDEKLYARDLEAAITLSLLNNTEGLTETSDIKDVQIQKPTDENTDPASLHLSNCSVNSIIMGLDKITSDSTASSRQTAKAAEERRKRDEDEDYQPKMTPDSESDEDYSEPAESEDEEFTVKKVIKNKKEKVTKKDKTKPAPASKKQKQPSKPSHSKLQSAVSPSVRSSPTAKRAPIKPAASCTVSAPKPAASLSPAGGRVPRWNPPAQIGKSPTSSSAPAVKSPGHGLRLGLSRLVRVKPLHPSVTGH